MLLDEEEEIHREAIRLSELTVVVANVENRSAATLAPPPSLHGEEEHQDTPPDRASLPPDLQRRHRIWHFRHRMCQKIEAFLATECWRWSTRRGEVRWGQGAAP